MSIRERAAVGTRDYSADECDKKLENGWLSLRSTEYAKIRIQNKENGRFFHWFQKVAFRASSASDAL